MIIRAVSRVTSRVEGPVEQSIKETRDQIIEFCRAGRAVKVDGQAHSPQRLTSLVSSPLPSALTRHELWLERARHLQRRRYQPREHGQDQR